MYCSSAINPQTQTTSLNKIKFSNTKIISLCNGTPRHMKLDRMKSMWGQHLKYARRQKIVHVFFSFYLVSAMNPNFFLSILEILTFLNISMD